MYRNFFKVFFVKFNKVYYKFGNSMDEFVLVEIPFFPFKTRKSKYIFRNNWAVSIFFLA